MWRALTSDDGGFAAGARLGRLFGGTDRRGAGLSDAFLVDLGETDLGAGARTLSALGRLVGTFVVVCSGRANAVNPGPPMLTRPGGGSLTSSTPNTMTPPGSNRSARCFVASRTAAASKYTS